MGRLKANFYGTSGTGKTRLACTFPKPLLLVGAEDGTASVVGQKGVDWVLLNETDELREVVELLKTGRYKSFALDTATKLREMRIAELWKSKGGPVPDKKPFIYADKAWKDVWVQCANDMKELLALVLDLPRVVELNVVILAQEANTTEDSGSSEFLRPNVASAVGKSVSDFVSAECDYIGQTVIRDKVVDQTVTLGSLQSTVKQKVGVEYALMIGPDPIYRHKFRRSLEIKEPLPEYIADPSYEKIVRLIRGERA